MRSARRSASRFRLALLAGLLLPASCAPAWSRRPPAVSWQDRLLIVEAPGSVEHVSFPLSCDLARKKAENAALQSAAAAYAYRFGGQPDDLPNPVFDVVGQERPSADSCYVLLRLTAQPGAPAQ